MTFTGVETCPDLAVFLKTMWVKYHQSPNSLSQKSREFFYIALQSLQCKLLVFLGELFRGPGSPAKDVWGLVTRGVSPCHTTQETSHCVLVGWPSSGRHYLTLHWVRTGPIKHLPKNKGSTLKNQFILRKEKCNLGRDQMALFITLF